MNRASSKTHRDLVVWQQGIDLASLVYRVTEAFPHVEAYGLTGQARRAALSVPSNIAEGACRNTGKDFLRFLFIARGSLSELETLLVIARDVGYLTAGVFDDLRSRIDQESALLNGLIAYLRSANPASSEGRKVERIRSASVEADRPEL